MVLLCDGRLVCGCADPYGKRVLGDARTTTVAAVWTGETASTLRRDLNAGGSKFCGDCPLKLPLKKDEQPPQRDRSTSRALPSRLYIETTAACNISCAQACCAPETGITRTRQAGMLDFDLFTRVVDEAGPSLGRIDFFNYGEAFLHKRAVEMCEYIKTRFPHIYLYTSTNGLAFSEEQVRRLVHSGIDEVTFSIDGATPESYVQLPAARRLRQGDPQPARRGRREARAGRDVPFINWRYILFTHNDSDEEMKRARAMAAEIGVDRLCWEMTDHPEDMFSRRFVPGSRELTAHPPRNLGRQQSRQRHPRRDAARARSTSRALAARAAAHARRTRPAAVPCARTCTNLSTRAVPRAGELWPPPGAPRRAAVRRGRHPDQSRLRARVAAGGRSRPGRPSKSPIDHHGARQPGRYRLKFDLVSEGIDWFEKPADRRPL